MGLLVIFGMAKYNTLDHPEPIPQGVNIAFDGLSRGAWALAVLWVIFACHKGYGGKHNNILLTTKTSVTSKINLQSSIHISMEKWYENN